ncbi:Crp/Fnr family transcriptional regulator [Devosia sp. CN2-171]|jgi:CRP-like cAMP-binding protein|uniref:Crp/Fnr family transcriptional regulator n=1 Tax=Devosia sp. CN2-171 TaxID=3400909 RepID=UPI003BF8EEE5
MAKPDLSTFGPFFSMVSVRDDLSDEERAAILSAAGTAHIFAAGEDLVTQGERPSFSTLVVAGMTARYSTVEDGGRQITGLHIPGDFVDLHSFPLQVMDHSVTAITDCEVVTFPHKSLMRITETYPHLTRVLWLLTLLDGAIHRQWMVTKGRLTADEQMAHLFCEQFVRAQMAGLARSQSYPFPLTQAQFGDALGLSIVHTNRTLQRLRRTGALEWEDGFVEIVDWPLLRELGQFDPTYLHLEKLRR